MKTHKHLGAEKLHPVTRVHKDPRTKRAHAYAIKKVAKVPKAPTKKKAVKKAVKKPSLVKRAKKAVRKALGGVQDYGRPPAVSTYEPILDFDPNNPPEGFIIVKMNHKLLDDMLQSMSKKKARAVGVPCRRL